MAKKTADVVAALLYKDGRFLACRRPLHKARGGLWEFVGGKVEAGESKEEALVRECKEELGVCVRAGRVFFETVHDYPDLTVHLTLFESTIESGEIKLLEHIDAKWLLPCETDGYEFCPADEPILKKLKERAAR